MSSCPTRGSHPGFHRKNSKSSWTLIQEKKIFFSFYFHYSLRKLNTAFNSEWRQQLIEVTFSPIRSINIYLSQYSCYTFLKKSPYSWVLWYYGNQRANYQVLLLNGFKKKDILLYRALKFYYSEKCISTLISMFCFIYLKHSREKVQRFYHMARGIHD